MPTMPIDRRHLLLGRSRCFATLGRAAHRQAFGLDAAHFGVRAGAPTTRARALQRAIDQAARSARPLKLAPGVYRAGGLTLPAGAQLLGVRGRPR